MTFDPQTLEKVFALLAAAGLLAGVVNALTAGLTAPFKARYPNIDLWWLIYVSWAIAAGVIAVTRIDLFRPLFPTMPEWLSLALSALITGRGANFAADLFKALLTPKSLLGPVYSTPATDADNDESWLMEAMKEMQAGTKPESGGKKSDVEMTVERV